MNKSRKKVNHRTRPVSVHSVPAGSAVGKQRKRRISIRLPYLVTLWLSLWVFCSVVYGSVFYISQQCSYFAWDSTLMRFLLQQDWGWLKAAGRFLLISFHYPVAGGLLLSTMLSLCVLLILRTFPIPARWRFLTALLPYGFLAYFVGLNYSINYHRETSWLFAIPLAALALLALAYAVGRAFTRRPYDTTGNRWTGGAVSLLLFAGFTAFVTLKRPDIITTCSMQRAMENSDWDKMIDEALSCRRPSRGVAAYYALALSETGQLNSRLFELPFDYPHYKVTEMDGSKSDGTSVYTIDADFYAGIPNASYHDCMEIMVKTGPQLFLLKRLARAAAINGEYRLCWKYLTIIDRNPLEHKFVKRYSAYIRNPKTIGKDPEFMHVYAKLPVENSFEQQYRQPIFMGYTTTLFEGRSLEALDACLMSLLYSKDQTRYMEMVRIIKNTQLAPYYQEAIAGYTLKDPNILSAFPTIDRNMSLTRLQAFVNDAQPYIHDMPKGQKELKHTWLNYYPYYLYFENLQPSGNGKSGNDKDKQGVN